MISQLELRLTPVQLPKRAFHRLGMVVVVKHTVEGVIGLNVIVRWHTVEVMWHKVKVRQVVKAYGQHLAYNLVVQQVGQLTSLLERNQAYQLRLVFIWLSKRLSIASSKLL